MSQMGLGCAKTPAVAPHVEISPNNCIAESQIILHTRGSMPCWRIVFSTFCGCMSFYTARVISRPHVIIRRDGRNDVNDPNQSSTRSVFAYGDLWNVRLHQ